MSPKPSISARQAAHVARLQGLAAVLAGLVIVVAVAVLIGWTFDLPRLKQVLPGLVAMNPVTAVTFLVSGLGLVWAVALPRERGGAVGAGAAMALVGALVLVRYLFGWDSGIDRALFTRSLQGNVMAPTAAMNFLFSGVALMLLDWEPWPRTRPAQGLGVLVALLALVVLTGYAYGVEQLYRLRDFIAMAMHTALAFFAFSAGLLCARADAGIMGRLTSDRAGGAMLRRLLLAQIAIPFLLGWIILHEHREGVLDPALGFSIFVVAAIFFVAVVNWRNAALLDSEDAERSRAEEELRATHAGLESAVAARTAELTRAAAGIRESLEVLSASAGSVLESSSDLAVSANEAAAAVNETTTAVEQVRQTARVASGRARRVAEAAQKSAEISTVGTAATRGTLAGMERIRAEMATIGASMTQLSEQSQAIQEIIAAVEDLAEQSNLLAVNAAVEAAHAGEHGKGFAIVAQEVKYLADQSRQATKQVRSILSEIQRATTAAALTTEQASKAVEAGVTTAEEAGTSIVSIEAHVGETAESAAKIAAATEDQLVGLQQIAEAMSQVATASRQHVDQARQLENAARRLNELGQRLKELVERQQTATP